SAVRVAAPRHRCGGAARSPWAGAWAGGCALAIESLIVRRKHATVARAGAMRRCASLGSPAQRSTRFGRPELCIERPPMTSHPDYPALEARLDFVHGRMLELQARVATLEAQLYGRAPFAAVANPAVARPITPPASLTPPLPTADIIPPTPEQRIADQSSHGPV